MLIIKATLEHLPALVTAFDAYRVFYKKDSDVDAAYHFLEQRLTNKDSVIYIVTENETSIKGFVQLYPLFSSTRMKKLWLLNDLFVMPNYRGQGISKALIEKAKELVIETHSCGIMLETEKSNSIANLLYIATGFSKDSDHNFYSWDV